MSYSVTKEVKTVKKMAQSVKYLQDDFSSDSWHLRKYQVPVLVTNDRAGERNLNGRDRLIPGAHQPESLAN